MIDIHSHIVFDVDDGPLTINESLALIAESYRQGVRTIVSTSHRRKGKYETPERDIYNHFLQVKREAEGRFADLTILYGGELFYTKDMLYKLEHHQLPRMNNTRFALIAFSINTAWPEMHWALQQVLRLGISPIIAHIECYDELAFQKNRVQELIAMGCYTQINSSHVRKPKLLGDKLREFKKRTQYLLEEDLVHCVASDMHHLSKRPPCMQEAYRIITKTYGQARAEDLFHNNPQALLNNDNLERYLS
ncbi:capsular polysaccharide biosynthesis protein Cps4B [Streptococcus halichoeri]|uniref:capsular polysaccharide biosynthesis protein Cps4B n=1 Tax=Streptococcus halichoeri TaxID=254785 RepID=UPI001356B603|nr:capsular polysaccharide biosynthesis protein Cps4B [Streptococcus halichoeri]